VAQVAVCSQINTKHINTVWAERTVVEFYTDGASRSQLALKVNMNVMHGIHNKKENYANYRYQF